MKRRINADETPKNADETPMLIEKNADANTRAYESVSVSNKEKITTLRKRNENAPSFEQINEAWKWYQSQYPREVNEYIETQLFLSVMETPHDLANLRANLPLYKQTKGWIDGYAPSSENFLSKRIFNVRPRDSPKIQPETRPVKYFDPKEITGDWEREQEQLKRQGEVSQ